jgi:hypothetical protein
MAGSHGASGSVLAPISFSARGIGTTIAFLPVTMDIAMAEDPARGSMIPTTAAAYPIATPPSTSASAARLHRHRAPTIVGISRQAMLGWKVAVIAPQAGLSFLDNSVRAK